jgi:hypothetical protein
MVEYSIVVSLYQNASSYYPLAHHHHPLSASPSLRLSVSLSLCDHFSSSLLFPVVALVQHLVEADSVQDTKAFLALHLMHEMYGRRGTRARSESEQSTWTPMLDTLPERPMSALFYTKAELAELQAPKTAPIFSTRNNLLATMRSTFEILQKTIERGFVNLFDAGQFTSMCIRCSLAFVHAPTLVGYRFVSV